MKLTLLKEGFDAFLNENDRLLMEEFEKCPPQHELGNIFVFPTGNGFDLPGESSKPTTGLEEVSIKSKKDEPETYTGWKDPDKVDKDGNPILAPSDANAKLIKTGVSGAFNIPAGWSCPLAQKCLAKVDPTTKKMEDLNTEFEDAYRCYAATEEAIRPAVRALRWHNFNVLKDNVHSVEALTNIIDQSLKLKFKNKLSGRFRIHSSGDFFHHNYFKAWIEVAKLNPSTLFYAYTKVLPFAVRYASSYLSVPNFKLIASEGGSSDSPEMWEKIKSLGIKYAKVGSRDELTALFGDRVTNSDSDDSFAYDDSNRPFGMVVHGVQAAGSWASKELSKEKKLRKAGAFRKDKF